MSLVATRNLKQARERLQQGDIQGAAYLCEQVLQRAPRQPEALLMMGIVHLMRGRPADALAPLSAAVAAAPQDGAALEHLGLVHLMLGQFDQAEPPLRAAAALRGAPPSVHMRLGLSLLNQGRHAEAINTLEHAIALAPNDADCQLNLGQAYARTGRNADASRHLEAALRLNPGYTDAMLNLGVIALEENALQEARQWFERALAQSPRYVDAMINLGVVLQRLGAPGDALGYFRRALEIDAANTGAGLGIAETLAMEGRLSDSRDQYLTVLAAAPDLAAAHEGLGSVCMGLGRLAEGIEHLKAALKPDPDNARILSALARAQFEVGQLDQAESAARRAIAGDGDVAGNYATLANIHLVRGELAQAIALLEEGYARTDSGHLLGMLTYQARQACDWTKWQKAWGGLSPQLGESARLGSPFWLLCEPATGQQIADYTRRWAAARFAKIKAGSPPAEARRNHPRIRIGYLSSDFQEHAVGSLIIEVFEAHDRDRFEVFAYSHGLTDETPMRRRFQAACEHFVDIAWETDDAAAERMRQDELDLLVDLKGYPVGDRLSIMARRPCATQLTWLGYPGTTGADFIDYLIADPFVVPEGQESLCSERVLRMPHCYQPTDRRRMIAETRSREEYGLPPDGVVFCCFNQTFKITPEIFQIWIRLLQTVPGSVLWLLETNPLAKDNLLAAARANGVASERLVFAPKLPNDQHLARYRAADLALDTFPYTSHTTASDALWCGCPVVGLCGDTFAAQVSGSILTAAGLPELITHSLPEYEDLARRLAENGAMLEEMRMRVAACKESPLFDPAGFARDLETLYLNLVRHP